MGDVPPWWWIAEELCGCTIITVIFVRLIPKKTISVGMGYEIEERRCSVAREVNRHEDRTVEFQEGL